MVRENQKQWVRGRTGQVQIVRGSCGMGENG